MPGNSTFRLDVADLERLFARFPVRNASGIGVVREGDRLLVRVEEMRLSTPLLPAFQATFAVKAALVQGARNVVAIHLQAEKLPLGLQAMANPFLDKMVERILPPGAAAYVEIRSPSLLWVRLEAIPGYGKPFAQTLTLTRLAAPGPDGAALEAAFGVRSA
jgi:hypothetical protein